MDLIKGILSFIGYMILAIIVFAILFVVGWAKGVNKFAMDMGLITETGHAHIMAAAVSALVLYMFYKIMHGWMLMSEGAVWIFCFVIIAVASSPIVYLFLSPSTPAA